MATELRKGVMVELVSPTQYEGKPFPFPAEHAEKILNSKSNTGPGAWALPKASKFALENGKLIRSATAKPDSEPSK